MKQTSILPSFVAAVLVTIITGLIYGTVQQTYRTGANDPQLQLARDIAQAIKNNKPIEKLLPADTLDLETSSGAFVILYDRNGKPVRSNVFLDNTIPQLAPGVLDFTKKHGENTVTWQPRKGIRMAMVIESVSSPEIAFVAAGRSLKETEERETSLRNMIFCAWILCIGVSAIYLVVDHYRSNPNKQLKHV